MLFLSYTTPVLGIHVNNNPSPFHAQILMKTLHNETKETDVRAANNAVYTASVIRRVGELSAEWRVQF